MIKQFFLILLFCCIYPLSSNLLSLLPPEYYNLQDHDVWETYDKTLRIKYLVVPYNVTEIHKLDEILKSISSYTCIKFTRIDQVPIKKKKLIYNGTELDLYKLALYYSEPKFISTLFFVMKRPLTKNVYYDIGKIMDLPLEHMRKERDNYIGINSDDDSEPYHDDIWEEYNISYDYGSRMHYPPITDEKNEKITIDPLDENYLHTIGQDDEFNFNDYKKINALFCSRKCGNFQNSCLRNGFSNPNRCKTCLCPPHYKGRYCDEYKTTNSKCGKILFTATDIPQFILHKGVADCYFYINTDYKHVIEVTIIDSDLYETKKHCPNKKSLEIRYRKDPSVMGAMFCGINKNKTMVSEGNDVSIHYSSRQNKNWFMLSFRRIPSKVNEQCLKKL